MNFLIDESADVRLAAHLRELGHDVKTVAGDYAQALEDREILRLAAAERRIVITFDRDFGELIFRESQAHAGVLYFRLGPIDLPTEIARLGYVLTHYADQLDQFLVITPARVRVRTYPRRG
jgi:predicted nuclease of predicted toxin-antitoxin system